MLWGIHACKPDTKGVYSKESTLLSDTILEIEVPPTDTTGNTVGFTYQADSFYDMGIGLLKAGFYVVNYRAGRRAAAYIDTLWLSDLTFSRPIGTLPITDKGQLVTYDMKVWQAGDTVPYFRCNYDEQGGMGNWEGAMKVYGQKGSWVNLFACRYGLDEVWLNLDDLDSNTSLILWLDYFKQYPEGNSGWKHGYHWAGREKAPLLWEPGNQDSVITLIDKNREIYPTGQYQGNWAEVVLKEVHYEYDQYDEYFQKAHYGQEWKGWIKVVSAKGRPLMTEIILGC